MVKQLVGRRIPSSLDGGFAMTRKALVIEDEKPLAELLGEHLRRWGYDPTILNCGKDAVKWVQTNKPCLVLLDLPEK